MHLVRTFLYPKPIWMLDIISVNRVFDHTHFDFLTLRERYDEKELKDALIEKVNNFLLELGTGFAYMS